MKTMKTFHVEGFGEVGAANLLLGFVNTSGKHWDDLEVGEACSGRVGKELVRVVRRPDHVAMTVRGIELPTGEKEAQS
jgi:hypothetical protein